MSMQPPKPSGSSRNSRLPPDAHRTLTKLVAMHGVARTARLIAASPHVVEELASGGRTTFAAAERIASALEVLT